MGRVEMLKLRVDFRNELTFVYCGGREEEVVLRGRATTPK
jgi:hypothetical protein